MTRKKENAYMHVRHGLSKTSEAYRTWGRMKSRCNDSGLRGYHNYGGRGISYCSEWEYFENFYADMGEPPPGMSLDRIDNDQGYSKENCRWASSKTQNYNQGLRRDNTSGVRGVKWDYTKGKWVAAHGGKHRVTLLQSKDFFEAVCARKSWEAHREI